MPKNYSRREMLAGVIAFFVGFTGFSFSAHAQHFTETNLAEGEVKEVIEMSDDVKRIVDQSDVVSIINRFFFSIDERDYTQMLACLTDKVEFDYSRLFGTKMPPTAGELVENVRQNHAGLRATQHLTANHFVSISDDAAQCTANFQAQHFLPNDRGGSLWTVAGRYRFVLSRAGNEWKIRGCTIYPTWMDGNLNIFDLAHEQARPNAK